MPYIDRGILDSVGETVTLKIVSSGGVDRWGNAVNETTTSKEVDGVFEPVRDEANESVEGDFLDSEIRAFFDDGVNDINEGNIIVYNGNDYRIDEVQKFTLGSNEGHYQARASLI